MLLTGGRDGPISRLAVEGRTGEAHELLKAVRGVVRGRLGLRGGPAEPPPGGHGPQREAGENRGGSQRPPGRHQRRPLPRPGTVQAPARPGRCKAQHHHRPGAPPPQAQPSPPPEAPCPDGTRLFAEWPEAVSNTLRIAEGCEFDLSRDLGYTLPDPAVPQGYTAESYLRRLCFEAAARRYGSVPRRVEERLREEFRLIQHLSLAGFLLLYREIVLIAQKIMEERGMVGPETPVEERPPGRGRGSSVALLVGYLIGISHVDPLEWGLTLERFISDDMTTLPDIDLDFPRGLRDELIRRVHLRFGPEYAVLAGAVSTYRVKGIIQDLGKALGLPRDDLELLSKQVHSHDATDLREEMLGLPAFRDRVEAPGWRDLLEMAPQLAGAPRGLGQHVGGMVLSSTPIPEMVPIRAGAMEGRFIMDWNRDSVADANFAKIDLLSLPVLDQMEEALDLVEKGEGRRPDMSRIDPEDPNVYDMINEGKSKGVFLLQSPAQLKMAQRLKSRNLLDLAYQVALIRPGVGVQGSAVSQFVERYRHGAPWEYDHPLERRALERGYGVIVWQEQVVQLLMDVAGMTAAQADEVRRAFARPKAGHLIAMHRERFLDGARSRGVPEEVGGKIFAKVNGHYMFPESHSHAFAVTAYQAAWLKRYHPLEFFVALVNNQPMGFYPLETIKEDARRFGVPFLYPCVNRSRVRCVPHNGSVLPGLGLVRGRWGGVGRAHRGGEGATRPLRHGGGPGAAHGPEAGGRAVPRDGRGFRCRHSQPQGGPVGGRSRHPAR